MRQVKGKYKRGNSGIPYDYTADIVEARDQLGSRELLNGRAYTLAITRKGELKAYYNAGLGGWLKKPDARMPEDIVEEIISRNTEREAAV